MPAQHRAASVALVQHGRQLALVAAVDAASKQLGGALGATHQHAQLARTLKECPERRGAFEDDVGAPAHVRAQWQLAQIGRLLRLDVWFPRAARSRGYRSEPLGVFSIATLP